MVGWKSLRPTAAEVVDSNHGTCAVPRVSEGWVPDEPTRDDILEILSVHAETVERVEELEEEVEAPVDGSSGGCDCDDVTDAVPSAIHAIGKANPRVEIPTEVDLELHEATD